MKQPEDFPLILSRIKTAESWRDNNYRHKWESWLKRYRSEFEQQPDPTRSHVFVPYTFMQTEVIRARLGESLFSSLPYITVMPRESNDQSTADRVQSLLNWQLNDRIGIARVFTEQVIASMCTFGTVVTYTGWQKLERKTKQRGMRLEPVLLDDGTPVVDENGEPVSVGVRDVLEINEVVYDDPVVQNVDLFDFFVDPRAANISEARYCGHREKLSRAVLDELKTAAGWDFDWDELLPDDSTRDGREIRNPSLVGDMSQDEKNGMYLVHHYWEDNRHVVIINDTVCALDEENPFWHGMKPYDKCCYIPQPNQFYGLGIPEVLHDLQDELNTNRNQRIDYNTIALRRMWKVRKGSGLTQNDLRWRQNGIIQVEDMDDVQEILVQQLPASAWSNEDVIKQDMRDATGCHDIIMGLETRSDETATTTMTKDNNASIRFKDVVKALVSDLLIPIAKKCIALDQQYMDETRLMRLSSDVEFADSLLSISPEDLEGCFDVFYVGSAVDAMANKELRKQAMVEVYNLLSNNPLVVNNPNSARALMREFLRAEEVENIDEILPAPMQQVQPQPMPQPAQPMLPGQPMPDIGAVMPVM